VCEDPDGADRLVNDPRRLRGWEWPWGGSAAAGSSRPHQPRYRNGAHRGDTERCTGPARPGGRRWRARRLPRAVHRREVIIRDGDTVNAADGRLGGSRLWEPANSGASGELRTLRGKRLSLPSRGLAPPPIMGRRHGGRANRRGWGSDLGGRARQHGTSPKGRAMAKRIVTM